MTAADEIKTYQKKEYLSKFLTENVRPDNRSLGETREAMLTLGAISTADGSAMVKLGNTVVVCGIKAEITRPPADTPNSGVILANVQLPPMCSPEFKQVVCRIVKAVPQFGDLLANKPTPLPSPFIEICEGPPSEMAQVLSDYVQQVLVESKMVDMAQLCIETGLHCWILYCDVMCCNYDGNIRDAVILATVAALKDLSLPKAEYNSEQEKMSVDKESTFSLDLLCLPLPLSFTIFDDKILLVDPTHEEESVCQGTVTVITTGGDNICQISKLGGASLNPQQLSLCITKAKQRWADINKLIRSR